MTPHGAGRGGGGTAGQLFDGASSSQTARRVVLSEPCRYFGLQVVTASSSAGVNLLGSLASSSDAPTVTLISYSSGTSGSVLSTESTAPIAVVTAQLVDTDAAVSAWFTATP